MGAPPACGGRTFSRQVRLRQVGGRAAQDLVLLLQQSVPAAELAQLRGVFTGLPGTVAVIDVCLADPFAQRHLVDAEVLDDLSEGDARFTGTRDTHDVVTELLRAGLGHGDHPSRPTRVGQPGSGSPIRAAAP